MIKDGPLLIVIGSITEPQILIDDFGLHLPLLLLLQLPPLSLLRLLASFLSFLLLLAFLSDPLFLHEGCALAAELVLVLVLETNVLRADLALLGLAAAVDEVAVVFSVLKHLLAV